MESANNANEPDKKCQLCRAGFEVWLSSLNFGSERDAKIRAHFLKYCPDCESFDKKEKRYESKEYSELIKI